MYSSRLILVILNILMPSGIYQIHNLVLAVINDICVVNKPTKNVIAKAVNYDYHFAFLHIENLRLSD
ncbi:hypothetical protein D3C85_1662790 [compost metagenome]